MARLIEPDPDRFRAWREAHREWGPGAHEDGFGLGPDDEPATQQAFAAWITRLRHDPAQHWWILDGDAVAGAIALRSDDDPAVARHGHIGYGIRPSFRRRGLATWALGQTLDAARLGGLRRALLVCAHDNAASARVIAHVGGTRDKHRPHDGMLDRYWVDLAGGTPAR